jgi:hypothetical protein
VGGTPWAAAPRTRRGCGAFSYDLDSSEQAVVTVESSNEGHPFLSATLEGALIDVSARDADGISYHREFRMVPNRNDERTAAYLLQNWMERL